MTTVTASIEVDVSAARLWDAVTDWERQASWMPQTRVTVDAGSPTGLGQRLTARSGVGPAAFDDPMVVEVWDAPRRCEVRHLGRVVTGRGIFAVEPVGENRSRFTWTEDLASTGVRRLLDPAAAPATKLLLTVALRRLARHLAGSRIT